MYHMTINEQYGIIENTFKYVVNNKKVEKLIKIETKAKSIIPNCTTRSITLEDVPPKVLNNPRAFIYDDGKYRICPYIVFDVENPKDTLKQTDRGEYYFVIDKDITILVKYKDPDNFNFRNEFNYIKLKDRYNFLHNIPTKLELGNDNCANFTIKSRFPGVTKLRAKDDKYICNFYPLEIRFRDEA